MRAPIFKIRAPASIALLLLLLLLPVLGLLAATRRPSTSMADTDSAPPRCVVEPVTASASPFLADMVAEGPVHRKGGLTWYIVSVRRSLIEETSPWLLGEKQPLGFSSYYVKLSSLSRDGGSRCSLTGMRSNDRGGLDPKDEVSRVG